MALPIVMLRPLHMRWSQKAGLGLIFGLVFINIVLEVLRTVLTIVVDFENFRGYGVVCFILQATLAVITCALPCYRGLVIKKSRASNWTLPTIATNTNAEKYVVAEENSARSSLAKSLDDRTTIDSV